MRTIKADDSKWGLILRGLSTRNHEITERCIQKQQAMGMVSNGPVREQMLKELTVLKQQQKAIDDLYLEINAIPEGGSNE